METKVYEDRQEAEASGEWPIWACNLGAGGTIYATGEQPGPDPETGEQLEWCEVVAVADACPKCGNDRVDNLVWDDNGERVTCAECGAVYTP